MSKRIGEKEALKAWDELVKPYIIDDDIELTHVAADNLLRDVLLSLGYTELISRYDEITKWYS